jgi:nucleoside-triphosphatase
VTRPARLLIEARPGAGKTTALGRLAELLDEAGLPVTGFLTREIRERGQRIGFEIESLEGVRGVLARVDRPGPPRVGRYGVHVDELERVALPALAGDGPVVLIDELGKMELLSERFREAVLALFEGDRAVVATVQASRHPFTDALKSRPEVELVRLTAGNRDGLPTELAARLGGGFAGSAE